MLQSVMTLFDSFLCTGTLRQLLYYTIKILEVEITKILDQSETVEAEFHFKKTVQLHFACL